MPSDATADVLIDDPCELGEGPVWDEAAGRLLWLDIPGRVLHTWEASTGTHQRTPLDRTVSFANPTVGGGLVTAGDRWVHLTDPDGSQLRALAELPIAEDASTNDGAVDPQGRLWVGATNAGRDPDVGVLLRVAGDGTVTPLRSGITLSNGIDWSPDGSVAYHVDTFSRRVDRLALDGRGDIVDQARFLTTEDLPDGLAVDAEGGVWIAFWDGGCVRRYTPDGALDTTIAIDAGRVTSCAFGGAGSTVLYVTTARKGMDDAELATKPMSGALFSVDVGVTGRGVEVFATT